MEAQLEMCRSGRISFDVFARETRRHWERLSDYLLRRWRAPVGVLSSQDLVQELLLGAWIAIRKWDPERGTTLRSYVIFNAVDQAKKHLHTQRKALRRDDKAPSRLLIPVSALHRDGEEEIEIGSMLPIEDDQERAEDVRRAFSRVSPELLPAVREYLLHGGFGEAAWGLLLDRETCRALDVTTYEEARVVVEEAVGVFVDGAAWKVLADQAERERLGVSTLSQARRAVLRDGERETEPRSDRMPGVVEMLPAPAATGDARARVA